VAEKRIKVTYRLTEALYERLKQHEKASNGVPQQRLIEQILDAALPKPKPRKK
jgi:predicted DNA binding CopG/RHH family protein